MSKAVMDNVLTLSGLRNLPRVASALRPSRRQDVAADAELMASGRHHVEAANGQRPGHARPSPSEVKKLLKRAALKLPATPAGSYPLIVGPTMDMRQALPC